MQECKTQQAIKVNKDRLDVTLVTRIFSKIKFVIFYFFYLVTFKLKVELLAHFRFFSFYNRKEFFS